MRLTITTRHHGPEGVRVPGQVIDLPDDEAEGLLETGAADFAADAPAPPSPAAPADVADDSITD